MGNCPQVAIEALEEACDAADELGLNLIRYLSMRVVNKGKTLHAEQRIALLRELEKRLNNDQC